jgi:hypothetical protein
MAESGKIAAPAKAHCLREQSTNLRHRLRECQTIAPPSEGGVIIVDLTQG